MAVAFGHSSGFAASDDFIKDEHAQQQMELPRRVHIHARDQFDLLIFRRNVNTDVIRSQFKVQFEAKLHELDRVCQLSDAQREKLVLASLGDMKRFFNQVDEVRDKYSTVVAEGRIPAEIITLRNRANSNLFEGGSFYEKVLQHTLSPEQLAAYTNTRYRNSIDLVFASSKLRRTVALKHEQQQSLKELLIDLPLPANSLGKKEFDLYVVMRQLSKLPPEKIQTLLDDRQWKMLQLEIARCTTREKELIHEGLIPPDNSEFEIQDHRR